MTGSEFGASAPSAELATKSGTIRPVTDGENRGRSGKYPPRYRTSNSGQLAASIRPVVSPAYSGQIARRHPPVVSQRIRGESESIRPVNAMRRRPLSGSKIGAASGKPASAPWSRSVFLGSIRPEIGQRNRGARGEHYPPRYRRCKSAPVSAIR
jgi:hypothetical protein